MTGELISLRMLVASATRPERELWREGARMGSVPVELLEAENAGSARETLARGGVDIILLDCDLPDAAAVGKAAHAIAGGPFVVSTASAHNVKAGRIEGADGVIVKPANVEEARKQIERCIRVKVPMQVLIVDDSATMRSIVRKILSASRYSLNIGEAAEGIAALGQMKTGKFDLVFLDYNMPGLNGFETLSEIKREMPNVAVVMMTSTSDKMIAYRARTSGAMAFLNKPFFPRDIDAVLDRYYGLQA